MTYIITFVAGFYIGMIITACLAVSAREDRREDDAERRDRGWK